MHVAAASGLSVSGAEIESAAGPAVPPADYAVLMMQIAKEKERAESFKANVATS